MQAKRITIRTLWVPIELASVARNDLGLRPEPLIRDKENRMAFRQGCGNSREDLETAHELLDGSILS